MKKNIPINTFILLLFSILLSNQSSMAWGGKGHTIVAEVAFQNLDEATKKNIMKYLGNMTLAEAANWMDDIKKDDSKDFMKPWHYINLEKGASAMPEGENIITALLKTMKELDNTAVLNDEEIKVRILYLFHLIGDLHQPLHVGYGSDRGGNDIKLSFYGKATNLHSIWDTEIIENRNMTVADVNRAAHYTPAEISEIKAINVFEWAKQSRGYLATAYKFRNGKIEMDYLDTNTKAVKEQLYKAGLRLASVLEKYFGNRQ
jgi:hypothetical protein